MAKVKIYLDPGESELDAHNALHKALDLQNSGATHNLESFEDPIMVEISEEMLKIHADIYEEMLKEIEVEIDREYE